MKNLKSTSVSIPLNVPNSVGPELMPLREAWDLGPFATVLQCLHLDKSLLELKNTKKL